METFDFETHYRRKQAVASFPERIQLDRELFSYYDSLDERGRKAFQGAFDAYLDRETSRIMNELQVIESSLCC